MSHAERLAVLVLLAVLAALAVSYLLGHGLPPLVLLSLITA